MSSAASHSSPRSLPTPLDGSLPPIPFGAFYGWEAQYPGGVQAWDAHALPPSLGEGYQPGLVPPPLPRSQPIQFPSDEILVSPVLSSDHEIARTRAWNVLRPTDEFHLLASTQESTAMGHWQNGSATIPELESFTIRVESNDRRVHGLFFTVNASRPFNDVSIWDVLDVVHRQCSCQARGQNAGQEGWMWGGLRPSEDEERVAILVLYEVPASVRSGHPA